MKWTRQSGKEIETNDEQATIEHCESIGWKRIVEEDERMTAIEKAVTMILGSGDENKLIASGLPDVKAMGELLGYEITAEERNMAYENHMKADS